VFDGHHGGFDQPYDGDRGGLHGDCV